MYFWAFNSMEDYDFETCLALISSFKNLSSIKMNGVKDCTGQMWFK